METPFTWNAALDQILHELRDLMIHKQRDYGPGNITAFGELGVLVRLSDKLERLKHLCLTTDDQGTVQWHPTEPLNETVDDTLRDLANYAIIALMLRRQWWMLPFIATPSPSSSDT